MPARLFLLLLFATATAGAIPAAASADTAPPTLITHSFTPSSVDVSTSGATVTVTVRVTDGTGAESPVVMLSSESTTQTAGFGQMARLSGTAQDGTYQRVMTVPQGAASGPWKVLLYPLRDTLGNSGNFATLGHVQVGASTPGDIAAPQLVESSFTPGTVDVSGGGASVTVTARVTDATAAEAPVVMLSSLATSQTAGFGTMTRISGTAQDGVYQRVMTVPQGSAPGSWKVLLYPLRDTAGNSGNFTTLGHVEVTSGTPADTAPPQLVGSSVTPSSVDVSAGPAAVTVTVTVSDVTGAQAPILSLNSATSTQTAGFGAMTLVSGSAQNGTFQRTVTIPQDAAPGAWQVLLYPLTDSAGNSGGFQTLGHVQVTDGPADGGDTLAPETNMNSPSIGTTTARSASFDFSSEPGTAFECRIDGGPWYACASPATVDDLAPGDHLFEVAATDGAGNRDATPASRSWTVIVPATPTPEPSPAPTASPSAAPAPAPAASPAAPVPAPIAAPVAPAQGASTAAFMTAGGMAIIAGPANAAPRVSRSGKLDLGQMVAAGDVRVVVKVSAKSRTLGSLRTTLRPGALHPLTLAVPRAARRALRRHKRVQAVVTIAVTPASGPAETVRRAISLKLR